MSTIKQNKHKIQQIQCALGIAHTTKEITLTQQQTKDLKAGFKMIAVIQDIIKDIIYPDDGLALLETIFPEDVVEFMRSALYENLYEDFCQEDRDYIYDEIARTLQEEFQEKIERYQEKIESLEAEIERLRDRLDDTDNLIKGAITDLKKKPEECVEYTVNRICIFYDMIKTLTRFTNMNQDEIYLTMNEFRILLRNYIIDRYGYENPYESKHVSEDRLPVETPLIRQNKNNKTEDYKGWTRVDTSVDSQEDNTTPAEEDAAITTVQTATADADTSPKMKRITIVEGITTLVPTEEEVRLMAAEYSHDNTRKLLNNNNNTGNN